jgi:hypothetical protein
MKAVLINSNNVVENIIVWDDSCQEIPGFKHVIVDDSVAVGIGWTCDPATNELHSNVDPESWKNGLSNLELRRFSYPPMTDYLDAAYWQSQGDDSKMNAYLAAVEAVKTLYPKN